MLRRGGEVVLDKKLQAGAAGKIETKALNRQACAAPRRAALPIATNVGRHPRDGQRTACVCVRVCRHARGR